MNLINEYYREYNNIKSLIDSHKYKINDILKKIFDEIKDIKSGDYTFSQHLIAGDNVETAFIIKNNYCLRLNEARDVIFENELYLLRLALSHVYNVD